MPDYKPDGFISYGKQWVNKDDIEAVVSVLQSDFLTQGSKISEFEQAICQYTGAEYCVVFCNATAGLHCAVKALDLPEGSEGITTPNTFVASANCLIYNHLKPVFADIDSSSYNIDPAEIRDKITSDTQVLIPVHFAGRVCEIDKISVIARENKLFVIEDAAHAIGGKYPDGTMVGNCRYSDMTVFSFHPVKTMTTGEGGAVTTNSETLYKKLLLLRSHGITKDPELLSRNDGPWYYEMRELGFNFRMTDIQAALGISQLNRLNEFKIRRMQIIDTYNDSFSGISWIQTPMADKADSCFHLYIVLIDFTAIGKDRTEVMETLRVAGIGTQVLYIPVHLQPYYQDCYNYRPGDFPSCENYYNKALALPLYPKMNDNDVKYVIENVKVLENNG